MWNELNTLDVYDPQTNAWATKASMPTPRTGLAAAAVNGKLYVAGGFNNNANVANLEVYDPQTNTWATKAPLPTARRSLAAAELGGKLYVAGGRPSTARADV